MEIQFRNFDFSSQKCLLFIFRVFVDLMLKLRLMSNFEKQTKILRVMRYMKQKCDRLISVVTRIHLIDLAQCRGIHAQLKKIYIRTGTISPSFKWGKLTPSNPQTNPTRNYCPALNNAIPSLPIFIFRQTIQSLKN